jgi:hypothetical protein
MLLFHFPPRHLRFLGNRVAVSSSISTLAKPSSMTRTQLLCQSPQLRLISTKLWLPWVFILKHAPHLSRPYFQILLPLALRILMIIFSAVRYWLPSILKHKHLAFRFLPQASYEEAAPLEISPSPDVITRVFMIFQGVTEEEFLKMWRTGARLLVLILNDLWMLIFSEC